MMRKLLPKITDLKTKKITTTLRLLRYNVLLQEPERNVIFKVQVRIWIFLGLGLDCGLSLTAENGTQRSNKKEGSKSMRFKDQLIVSGTRIMSRSQKTSLKLLYGHVSLSLLLLLLPSPPSLSSIAFFTYFCSKTNGYRGSRFALT
jgi:hypothetical protein